MARDREGSGPCPAPGTTAHRRLEPLGIVYTGCTECEHRMGGEPGGRTVDPLGAARRPRRRPRQRGDARGTDVDTLCRRCDGAEPVR